MKKCIIGLLVWNLFLTVAIGSCVYSLKLHFAVIVKTVSNVSGLVAITKEFSKQQEKITDIINVATILGDIPFVETVKDDGIIKKGIACNKIFTPEEIAKYRLKNRLINLPGENKSIIFPVIHPTEKE